MIHSYFYVSEQFDAHGTNTYILMTILPLPLPQSGRNGFTHPILYDKLCEDYDRKGQRTNSMKKSSYILEVEGAQNPYATVRNRKQHYADSTPGLRKCTLTGYATLRNPTQRLRRSNTLFFPEYAGNFCVLPTQLYANLGVKAPLASMFECLYRHWRS